MTLSALMGRPATIIRRSTSGSEDIYGNDVPTESVFSTTCELQQIRRDEPGAEGEVSRTEWLGIFPTGTDLHTDDAVIIDGAEYELAGDPWDANSGSAAVHHVEATLWLVAGAEDSAS